MAKNMPSVVIYVAIVVVWALSVLPWSMSLAAPKDKDKDKTPPVVSELRTESVTASSVLVAWTTDEPADSDIKYGVAPKTNTNGPSDVALVLLHTIALSELTASTTYAFCIQTRDEANNKTETCSMFTTLAFPQPPPLDTGGRTGGGVRPTSAALSGFAYPGATVVVTLRALPFGSELKSETTAAGDGSFSASFSKFPQGLYFFTVSAIDAEGNASARRGYQFDFKRGDAPLYKEKIIIPPTLTLVRDVLTWGDNIAVSGYAVPGTGVLVGVEDVLYEAEANDIGQYTLLINSARFTPGKITLRARPALISAFGYDYSPSKTVTLTLSSVPQADLNKDGKVNITDFSMFLAHPVDINSDTEVNSTDISIFLRAFSTMSR